MEVEIVNPNPKPPEKVLKNWTREWFEGGRQMELSKPPTRLSFEDPTRSLGHGVAATGGKLRLLIRCQSRKPEGAASRAISRPSGFAGRPERSGGLRFDGYPVVAVQLEGAVGVGVVERPAG